MLDPGLITNTSIGTPPSQQITTTTTAMLSLCNQSVYYERPDEHCIDNDMKISQSSIITVAIYSLLFCLSSIFNLTIIIYLTRTSTLSEQPRIHRIMLQLIIADLLVTFITIPLEIGWKLTVYWRAGDLACRFFQFLRPMGIYLGSFVIISLCIDRFVFLSSLEQKTNLINSFESLLFSHFGEDL